LEGGELVGPGVEELVEAVNDDFVPFDGGSEQISDSCSS